MDQAAPRSFQLQAIPIAFGLALAFAIAQAVLAVAVNFAFAAAPSDIRDDILGVALGTIFLWAHAFYVLLVTDVARPPTYPVRFASRFVASIPLTIVFATFVWLNVEGNAYSCGDGHILRNNIVPVAPWIWIGWASVTFLALPERFAAWSSGRRCQLSSPWARAIWMLLFAAPVWFFGYIFQALPPDCTPPYGGWGMFEGGMVLFPLLGIFLFAMSTSMAILMAIFRRT